MKVELVSTGWRVGILIALSLGACDAVDHPVGAAKEAPADAAGGNGADGGGINVSVTSDSTTSDSGGGDSVGVDGGVNVSVASASVVSGGVGGSAGSAGAGDSAPDQPLIPDNCSTELDDHTDLSCVYEAVCDQQTVIAHCEATGDVLDCDCGDAGPGTAFQLTGVSTANACSHVLALCLRWPELEASPFECTPSAEAEEPGFCLLDGDCSREGDIGDAHFIEYHHRQSDCSETESGWTCGCGEPNGGLFKVSGSTNDPQCLDAFDWCVEEEVERNGDRTCAPTSESTLDDGCYIDVQCAVPATLSGREGTILEDDRIFCQFASGEFYSCTCTYNGEFEVSVLADPLTACTQAVTACNER